MNHFFQTVFALILLTAPLAAHSQAGEPILFSNVLIFDSDAVRLSAPFDVLVSNGRIAKIRATDPALSTRGV